MGALLPPLRQELRLTPGSPLPGGAPGFVLFDPIRHLFFQLGTLEQRIVKLWGLRDPEAIREHLVSEGEATEEAEFAIATFHHFAATHSLLRDHGERSVGIYAGQRAMAKRQWWRWLVDHYLFVRIPLVRPAAFLSRSLPLVRNIWSRFGITLLAMLGLTGLFLVTRQWDAFVDTSASLLSMEGLFTYLVALAVVKCFHEAGHAYVATRFGCRVPTMGISLLVMMPVLYTDTSAAWRLRSRRHRMLIDAAGVLAEFSVAAVCLFAWSFLPDGPARTAAFALATTSLATTLLINASPFMRFDGYYLLSDALGVPNLAPRSFALVRWRLRQLLFGLDEPPPEELSQSLQRTMTAYGVVTIIYRTILYVGIALLVYHAFFKALGILLFIVEVIVFLINPVRRELKDYWARRDAIRGAGRFRYMLMGLGALFVLALLPLDRSVSLPAILTPIGDQVVVAGDPARIERILVRNGQTVAAGQQLLALSSPDLDLGEAQAQLRITQLQSQIARGGSDRQDLADLTVLHRNLIAEQDRLAGFARRRIALSPRATTAGRVVDLPRDLSPGMWVDGKTALLRVVTSGRYDVRAYASESEGWRLLPAVTGRFVPDDGMAASWRVRLDEAGSAAIASLDQPQLASTNGGPIAVTTKDNGRTLVPKRSLLPLHLIAERDDPPGFDQPMTGEVILPARGDSPAAMLWRAIGRVFARESSLQ